MKGLLLCVVQRRARTVLKLTAQTPIIQQDMGSAKRFFVPGAATPEQAEQIYEQIKHSVKSVTGHSISGRRVSRIEYTLDGKDHRAEVGEEATATGEEVIAILESMATQGPVLYFVCTPNRGVKRPPIYVGVHEVKAIEDFGAQRER